MHAFTVCRGQNRKAHAMSDFLKTAGVAFVVIGTGAGTVSVMNDDLPDLSVPALPWAQSGALDGRIFVTRDTIDETGEVVYDTLRFFDGRFQSSRAQIYCDFGWTDYQTWLEEDVVHFTTTTVCDEAPHTVVWYGTVRGDAILLEGTWTTRRWYWTQQTLVIGIGESALTVHGQQNS